MHWDWYIRLEDLQICDDGAGQTGVGTSERLGREDVKGTSFAANSVARDGTFEDGEGMRIEAGDGEDFIEIGWFVEFTVGEGGFLRKL